MTEGIQALTERERETLRLLLGGHDIKSIAGRLGLSPHTVNERLREARRKLGVSSSRQAARLLAEREGQGPIFSADRQLGVAAQSGAADIHGASQQARRGKPPVLWLAGGALIMLSIIAAVVLTSSLQEGGPPSGVTPTPAAAITETAASRSGRAWATLLDDGRWDASWAQAGTLFKTSLPQASWAAKAQAVRQPLGPVASRRLQSVTKAASLPGAPNGEYEIVQFATAFAQNPGATETVVLAREASGWKVDGYFIK